MRDDDALEHNPEITRRELAELHESLFGWCLSCCGYDRAAAEDLMQQCYVELLSGRARFDGRATLKTFLFGVARMLARSRYRRLLSRLRLVTGSESHVRHGGEHSHAFVDHGRSQRVWASVSGLPARQRDVTELVFCRELTLEEAAAVMGVSIGTARVHYARAKKSLARELADLAHSGDYGDDR